MENEKYELLLQQSLQNEYCKGEVTLEINQKYFESRKGTVSVVTGLNIGKVDVQSYSRLYISCETSDQDDVVAFCKEYKTEDEKKKLKELICRLHDKDGKSPLHVAIENGCSGIVTHLITHGGDFSHTSNDGSTCLDFAMNVQEWESSKKLIHEILETYPEQLEKSYKALVWGLENGKINAVTYLVEHHIKKIRTDIYNNANVLHLVVKLDEGKEKEEPKEKKEKEQADLLHKLLEKIDDKIIGYLMNEKDSDGHDPINAACHLGKWLIAVILAEKDGRYSVIKQAVLKAVEEGVEEFEKLQTYLSDTEDILEGDAEKLLKAAEKCKDKNDALIKLVSKLGVKIGDRTEGGFSLLHLIAAECDKEDFCMLMKISTIKSLDIFNVQCHEYEIKIPVSENKTPVSVKLEMCTPMHIAVLLLKDDLVREFIAAGASATKGDKLGRSPIQLLQEYKDSLYLGEDKAQKAHDMLDLLKHVSTEKLLKAMRKGLEHVKDATQIKDHNPLHSAVSEENLNAVRKCISEGWAVDDRDKEGVTPLVLAIERGNIDIVKLLMLMGVGEIDKTRILHVVAFYGQVNLLELLEEIDLKLLVRVDQRHQLNVYFKSDLSENAQLPDCPPLHVACYMNKPDMVRQLLKYRASRSAEDRNGLSGYKLVDKLRKENEEKYKDVINILRDIDDKGSGSLHRAIDAMDVHAVFETLKKGTDIELCNKDGITPLALSIKKATGTDKTWKDVIQMLIFSGVELDGIWHYIAFYGREDVLAFIKDLSNAYPVIKSKVKPIHADFSFDNKEKVFTPRMIGGDGRFPLCPAVYIACLQGHDAVLKKMKDEYTIDGLKVDGHTLLDHFKLNEEKVLPEYKTTYTQIKNILEGKTAKDLHDEPHIDVSIKQTVDELKKKLDKLCEKFETRDQELLKEMKGLIDKNQEEMLTSFKNFKSELMVQSVSSSMSDLTVNHIVFQLAMEMAEHSPIANEKAWKGIYRKLFPAGKQFQDDELNEIQSQTKSDVEAALTTLNYWKVFSCHGRVTLSSLEELCKHLEEIGMDKLSNKITEKKEWYLKRWRRHDKEDYLSEKKLQEVADQLGCEDIYPLFIRLGLKNNDITNLLDDYSKEKVETRIFKLFIKWKRSDKENDNIQEMGHKLITVLVQIDRGDLANSIRRDYGGEKTATVQDDPTPQRSGICNLV